MNNAIFLGFLKGLIIGIVISAISDFSCIDYQWWVAVISLNAVATLNGDFK